MHTHNLLGFGVALWLGGWLVVLISQRRSPSTDRAQPSAAITLSSPAAPHPDELADLRNECQRLRTLLHEQRSLILADAQQDTFEHLQSLLTTYPTLRKMVEVQPTLPARNSLALLTALDNWLQSCGIQPIGEPWQSVAYNPQQHSPDDNSIMPGETVYVRFVGYHQGDRILCPARVSRTRPGQG